MFKKFSSQPTPADNQASQPSVQAQPSRVVEPPSATYPTSSNTSSRTNGYFYITGTVYQKRLKGIKGSASVVIYHESNSISFLHHLLLSRNLNLSPHIQRLKKGGYGLEGGSSNSSTSKGPQWQSGNTVTSHLSGWDSGSRHGLKWKSW